MIRAYEPSDTEDIVDVWYKASSLAHPFLSDEFQEKEKDNIRKIYLPNTETWVYEDGDRLVGFISMIGTQIGAIFLDPSFHRRGIGKAMLDWVVQKHGDVEVEVFKENEIGRSFYKKMGFRFQREYIHEPTSQIVYCLQLSGNKDSANENVP